jgi:hypothetical protein
MAGPLLAPVISMQRTVARMDRFARSLASFKAAVMVKAEAGFILDALDAASGADSSDSFDVHMTAAECGVLRMERHLAALKAEISRGRG